VAVEKLMYQQLQRNEIESLSHKRFRANVVKFLQIILCTRIHLPMLGMASVIEESHDNRGRSRGQSLPLNPTKVTFFTIILYNSGNSIRDIRPF